MGNGFHGDIPRQGTVRCRMRHNALQHKGGCRLLGSQRGVRFNVTPPYAHTCATREGANKSPNIKMRLCKYLNLIN